MVKFRFKITSIIIAFVLLSSLSINVYSVADYSFEWANDPIPTEFYYNNYPIDENFYLDHLSETYHITSVDSASVQTSSTLPETVDLSTSPHFPPIRSQGNMGSCVAFSITYYQFTYEANKLNGIASDSASTVYSPKWTYYGTFNENSANGGSYESDVYDFLKDHGALKWSDDPYLTAFDSSLPWPTDTDAMRSALQTRVKNTGGIETFVISSSGTAISSPSSSALTPIKTILNEGKVLRIGTNYDYEKVIIDGKHINYRCNGGSAKTHSMIVVGYDDTITYDINGNGTIDSGERGAFKLANSYGDNFATNGYEWVMYDALNGVSSVGENWEISLDSVRLPAFSMQTLKLNSSDNWFVAMYVENKSPSFVAEVNATFNNLFSHAPGLYKKSVNSTNQYDNFRSICLPICASNIVKTRTLLFDYDQLFNSLENDIAGYEWGVSVAADPYSINSVQVNTSKLTDIRGNTIVNFTQNASNPHRYFGTVNLNKGDVNYDGILSTLDVQEINKYIAKYDNFSNVQIYLADYNNDGIINLTDSSAILNSIN